MPTVVKPCFQQLKMFVAAASPVVVFHKLVGLVDSFVYCTEWMITEVYYFALVSKVVEDCYLLTHQKIFAVDNEDCPAVYHKMVRLQADFVVYLALVDETVAGSLVEIPY